MKAGLVGYAQTGKTTLFNALTGLTAQTGAAGRGSKANLGVIRVPDARIDKLSSIFKPRKTIYAEVHFVDVPGPRAKGSGLDAATIQALQGVDALAVVLRGFPSEDGTAADPIRELADFDTELLLNDQIVIERRLERMKKEKGREREQAALEKCFAELGAERALRGFSLPADEERELASYSFLSRRPLLAVVNVPEADAASAVAEPLAKAAAARGVEIVSICASIEAEIARLPTAEQADFLASMGIAEPAAARFIRGAYKLLDYVSFFTVGEDEVRAWTIRRGDKAPRAAGRVHSDIERGFIRAEVMPCDVFVEVGTEAKMRDLGKLRVEGKDYVVHDGDIVNFRFNV
ncbi:MAG: DUF933 domain-containing protein [Myxococcales bacterium]